MTELQRIPFHGGEIVAIDTDNGPRVAVRHICEAVGIDTRSQLRKLARKPWAVVVNLTMTAADGKGYETATVDRRTLTMWLATIDTNAVADEARPFLVALQNEAADALDAYFHDGGAINPNATVEQVDALATELAHIRQRAEIVQALRGVIAADYLDAKARILLGQAMGEVPKLDDNRRPLYVQDYLYSRKLSASEVKAISSTFGKLLRGAYFTEYGDQPAKAPQEIRGRIIDVYAYTEEHRFLFDRVWIKNFADGFAEAEAAQQFSPPIGGRS